MRFTFFNVFLRDARFQPTDRCTPQASNKARERLLALHNICPAHHMPQPRNRTADRIPPQVPTDERRLPINSLRKTHSYRERGREIDREGEKRKRTPANTSTLCDHDISRVHFRTATPTPSLTEEKEKETETYRAASETVEKERIVLRKRGKISMAMLGILTYL